MSDDEERFLSRNTRRMKVHPERLLNRLRPLGFILSLADRNLGLNRLDFIRPTPDLPGLFDILHFHADTQGQYPAVYVGQSILPCPTCKLTGFCNYIPGTHYGYDLNNPRIRSVADAIELEVRVTHHLSALLADALEREGRRLFEETVGAREAAERYLKLLQPSNNLTETFTRLKSSATPEQLASAAEFVRREPIDEYNLVDFRIVWEIAGLCQILFWERTGVAFRGRNSCSQFDLTADDIEAHRRFQLVASRLARAPGWPIVDPLVPNRCDLEDTIVWRDYKPPYVAQMFDKYLSTIDRRCVCGKCLYYVRHTVAEQEPRTAEVLARCNNGHEETIELAAAGLGTLLPS